MQLHLRVEEMGLARVTTRVKVLDADAIAMMIMIEVSKEGGGEGGSRSAKAKLVGPKTNQRCVGLRLEL